MVVFIFPDFASVICITESIVVNDKIIVSSSILNFFVICLIYLLENCLVLLDFKLVETSCSSLLNVLYFIESFHFLVINTVLLDDSTSRTNLVI